MLISKSVSKKHHSVPRGVLCDPMQQQLGCLFCKVNFPNAEIMIFIMIKHVEK